MKQLQDYFKTKKRLQTAINNMDRIEGLEEYLDNNFKYLMFDCDDRDTTLDDLFYVPYWLDSYDDNLDKIVYSNYYHDRKLGDILKEKNINIDSLEEYREEYQVQYVAGYSEPYNYGDTINIDGKFYIYIDSFQLPVEMEHQAESGEFVIEYRGFSFGRILIEDKYIITTNT